MTENSSVLSNKNTTTMDFPTCLTRQLKAGYAAEKSETDYPNYIYSSDDLDCTIQLLENELKKANYRFPTAEELAVQVKMIFDRQLDYSLASKYVYISGNSNCERELRFNRNSLDEMVPKSYYLVKEKGFITELFAVPEIVDYQKTFPDAAKSETEIPNIENNIKIFKWKDVDNLREIRRSNVDRLINRNLFLFNSKSLALHWLLEHDADFMKLLLTKYGYDKSEQMNRFFINSIRLEKRPIDVISYFLRESCDGKMLKVNSNFINSYLKKYEETHNPGDVMILRSIAAHVISDKSFMKYSSNEKMKIVSNLANVFDPLFKKYHNNSVDWGTLTIFADLVDYYGEEWAKMKSVIVANNYYGLSNVKDAIEYAEQFDSAGAPD